jgi:pimeloyl-ACP methyl ester carboxylesterase
MWRRSLAAISGLILSLMTLAVPAGAVGLDPAFSQPLLGPEQAVGVVVWNHGRSINTEDADSPTPPYLRVLRDAHWDVLRFNRLRDGDTLSGSARRLVELVGQLKRKGYHRIALAGQSFGAFLALMAAASSDDVDTVVATAPAAFGNFDEFYDSWRLNAARLYPLLERTKRARIMLFFFHGDDFDPGGRGEHSRTILAGRQIGFSVVDQPAFLSGHWASSTGLFLRRFGNCIREFLDTDKIDGEKVCEPVWGEAPSPEMRLPEELVRPRAAFQTAAAAAGGSAPGSAPLGGGTGAHQSWYGFYPNGREVLLAVEETVGSEVTAVYAIGPGIDENEPAEWSRRKGRLVDGEFVFEEKGKSTLHFRPRADRGLGATWTSPDGKTSMDAGLRRLDLPRIARRAEAR